jgi:thiol:disulfide interchange protein
VPTIGLLFALWGACWWIARVPLTASSAAQAGAWLAAVIFVGVMWVLMFPGIDDVVSGKFSFGGLHEVMASRFNSAVDRELAERLEAFRQRGYEFVATGRTDARADGPSGSQTVLVDFTADWCATCKTLEATRLNTAEVRALVEKNGVVPMKGDWTHEEPEVTAMLDLLGARQVPTLAIFPAENPSHPIIFRGWYSLEELLAALEKAGPSRPRVTVRAATGKQGAEKKSWSRLESTDAVAYK